jgi:hypothetical protein
LSGKVPHTPAPGLTWGQLGILNERGFAKHRHRAPADALKRSKASYQRALSVVESIPEADLFAPGRYAWTEKGTLAGYVIANTCNHYRWARTQIRQWMKSQGISGKMTAARRRRTK